MSTVLSKVTLIATTAVPSSSKSSVYSIKVYDMIGDKNMIR